MFASSRIYLLAAGAALFVMCASCSTQSGKQESARPDSNTAQPTEPVFRTDGTLTFADADGKVIRTVQVEVADSDIEQQIGMMYRTKSSDDQAMLFIFRDSRLRSFYMKNTYVSLDIIFLSTSQHVVSIAENAVPLSMELLWSNAPSQYVVEVPAGFALRYGIKVGDRVDWKLAR